MKSSQRGQRLFSGHCQDTPPIVLPSQDKSRLSNRFPSSNRSNSLPSNNNTISNTGNHRWMVPYADFLTILLGFFLVLLFTSSGSAISSTTPDAAAATQQEASHIDNNIPEHEAKGSNTQSSNQPTKHSDVSEMAVAFNKDFAEQNHQEGITIQQQSRGLVISFKDHILFEPGSATLSKNAVERMKALTHSLKGVLAKYPHPVRVEGHTDNTPIQTAQFHSNWELSTARATTIIRYLVEEQQFPPDQLSAMGYGEFRPIDDNSSIKGKQNNRRVDIVILSPDNQKEAVKQDLQENG